jgi:tetratricopeptide (TPR) repeat protein
VRGLLAFCLVFVPVLARAAGYDDFNRGIAATNRGDSALAISSFTSALAAGDLNASLVPIAYLDRGLAYLRKGKCADAVTDLDAALKLKPDYLQALYARASGNICTGNLDAAISDIDAVLKVKPDSDGYTERAKVRWEQSNFTAAAADYEKALELQPKATYSVIWLEMSRMRGGIFDVAQMRRDMAGLAVAGWPSPVFNLYLGNVKPDFVNAAAASGDPQTAINWKCEANFYVAEWWLAQKNTDAAKPLLLEAQAKCPRDFVEYEGANVELKRLH